MLIVGLIFSSLSSDSDKIEKLNSNQISVEDVIEQPKLFKVKSKNNFITDKLAAALSRCKIVE